MLEDVALGASAPGPEQATLTRSSNTSQPADYTGSAAPETFYITDDSYAVIRSYREPDCRAGGFRELQYSGVNCTTDRMVSMTVAARAAMDILPKPEHGDPSGAGHERAVSGADLRRHW
jgi:hypothetical protein